jgi:hypothetical protein
MHTQLQKNFLSPVNGIYKPAAGLYINANLTTRALFGRTNGFNNALFFYLSKKLGLFLPGK